MKFHKAARPVIMGQNGMVSSGHYLASLAGVEILKEGGNAVDAALAAAFVSVGGETRNQRARRRSVRPGVDEEIRQGRSAQLQRPGAGQGEHRRVSPASA